MTINERHWIQEINDSQERRKERLQGLDGTYAGMVEGVGQDTERAQVTSHGGKRPLRVMHPYVGPSSGIRVMPESGTQVLLNYRSDSNEPEIVAYYQYEAERRIASFYEGKDTYRVLNPGEIELSSSGGAQQFLGARPAMDQYAGLVHNSLNQDGAAAESKAAVHWRRLHLQSSGEIGDEERLGVVWRWASKGAGQAKSRYRRQYVKSSLPSLEATADALLGWSAGPFAKEYLRSLKSGSDTTPSILADLREGDVIDDDGKVMKSSFTGAPLRSLRRYYTLTDQVLSIEVDQMGNLGAALPRDAVTGMEVKIPSGGLSVKTGRDMSWNGKGNWAATMLGSVDWLPGRQFNVGTLHDEPAVLGAQLVTLLGGLIDLMESHFHPSGVPMTGPTDPASVARLEQLRATFLQTKQLLSDFIFFSKAP